MKWLILIIIILSNFLIGATLTDVDSLIDLKGVKPINQFTSNNIRQVEYRLKVGYPAVTVIEHISHRLKSKGWHPLNYDFINPQIPSSHVSGWSEFIDRTKKPILEVHQWLAQWENKNHDILWCLLRYSYPLQGKTDLDNLSITIRAIPAKEAAKLKTK